MKNFNFGEKLEFWWKTWTLMKNLNFDKNLDLWWKLNIETFVNFDENLELSINKTVGQWIRLSHWQVINKETSIETWNLEIIKYWNLEILKMLKSCNLAILNLEILEILKYHLNTNFNHNEILKNRENLEKLRKPENLRNWEKHEKLR